VQPGVALTVRNSDLTIGTAGAVVSGLDVRGCVTVNAKNVTIRNVKVTGSCFDLIRNNSTGLVIEHVTLVGADADTEGIGQGDFTVSYANISHVGDGIRANGNVVVRDSYIHDLAAAPGSHNDGIQVTAGSNITIEHNTIENPNNQTSAIMLGADQGDISDIVVQNNLLNGGGWTLYGGAQPPSGRTIANIRLLDNVFGKKFWSTCGSYGPMAYVYDPNITVSGNVWQGTNTSVN
jgi:hypothetical protein